MTAGSDGNNSSDPKEAIQQEILTLRAQVNGAVALISGGPGEEQIEFAATMLGDVQARLAELFERVDGLEGRP